MGLQQDTIVTNFFRDRIDKMRQTQGDRDLLGICDLVAAVVLMNPEIIIKEVEFRIFFSVSFCMFQENVPCSVELAGEHSRGLMVLARTRPTYPVRPGFENKCIIKVLTKIDVIKLQQTGNYFKNRYQNSNDSDRIKK